MAKSTTITVNVSDQQFRKFASDFNKLTRTVEDLNSKWAKLNTTTARTSGFIQSAVSATRTMHQEMRGFAKSVSDVTKTFAKWGAMITGVTAALGYGGMFGIDRLANSIMQKRRQVMALGENYGRAQAAGIYGQTLFGGQTGSVLQNIKKGLMGDTEIQKSLVSLGIPFGSEKKPYDALKELLPKLPALLRSAGPGMELKVADAYRINRWLPDDAIRRLAGKSGEKEVALMMKRVEQEQKLLDLQEDVQEAWTDLEMQFQLAKGQIQKTFAEALIPLTEPLQELSKSIVDLMETIMKLPIVRQLIEGLANVLKEFDEFLKKDETKEMLKEWGKALEKVKWEDLKNNMNQFVEEIKKTVELFKSIMDSWIVKSFGEGYSWGEKHGGVAGGLAVGAANLGGTALQQSWEDLKRRFTGERPGSEGFKGATGGKAPGTPPTSPSGTMPSFEAGRPSPPAASGGGGAPSLPSGRTQAGAPLFSGGQMGPMATRGKNSIYPMGMPNWLGQAMESTSGGQGPAGWAPSVQNAVPKPGDVSPFPDTFQERFKGASGKLGALNMDNWQGTKQSKLVVHNVPGSNVFMTATGLSGAVGAS